MIFKKIGNMENVEAICHYFRITGKRYMHFRCWVVYPIYVVNLGTTTVIISSLIVQI